MRNLLSLAVILFFTALFPLACLAEVAADQAAVQAKEISGNVMSPYCPGRLLSDCPSTQAAELRHKIEERLTSGESKDKVFDWIYAVYGDGLRATPKTSGFGLVAWIAPFVFLGLGLIGVYVWLKRKSVNTSTEASPALDPALQARVDSELNN